VSLPNRVLTKGSGMVDEKPPKPDGYAADNGMGKPTHLYSEGLGEWVATPYGYRTREDGFPSHKWLRDWEGDFRWFEVPTMEDFERWDSVCETPEGEPVEPDHPRSWLVIMRMILT
jgi:hypothetical protein